MQVATQQFIEIRGKVNVGGPSIDGVVDGIKKHALKTISFL